MFSTAIFASVVAYFIYSYIQNANDRTELVSQPVNAETLYLANQVTQNSNPHGYKCDGRIHCSEMSSKSEADWFVANCPGTKMDGDNDGDACEGDSRW